MDDANEFEDGDGDGGGDEEHASTSGTITVAAQGLLVKPTGAAQGRLVKTSILTIHIIKI